VSHLRQHTSSVTVAAFMSRGVLCKACLLQTRLPVPFGSDSTKAHSTNKQMHVKGRLANAAAAR